MKTKVEIPPKLRPIMFLMFGLGFGFSLGFRGSGEFPRGYTLSIDFQQISFSKQHRIPWSGFYWRLE